MGDNAGPRKEKTKGGFDTFCAEYCAGGVGGGSHSLLNPLSSTTTI